MTGIRAVSFADRTADHTINPHIDLDRQEPRLLVVIGQMKVIPSEGNFHGRI